MEIVIGVRRKELGELMITKMLMAFFFPLNCRPKARNITASITERKQKILEWVGPPPGEVAFLGVMGSWWMKRWLRPMWLLFNLYQEVIASDNLLGSFTVKLIYWIRRHMSLRQINNHRIGNGNWGMREWWREGVWQGFQAWRASQVRPLKEKSID